MRIQGRKQANYQKRSDQATVSFRFTSDWSRGRREFCGPITGQGSERLKCCAEIVCFICCAKHFFADVSCSCNGSLRSHLSCSWRDLRKSRFPWQHTCTVLVGSKPRSLFTHCRWTLILSGNENCRCNSNLKFSLCLFCFVFVFVLFAGFCVCLCVGFWFSIHQTLDTVGRQFFPVELFQTLTLYTIWRYVLELVLVIN